MSSVSTAPPRRGLYSATVIENRALCTEHYRLTLEVPNFPPSMPGQFVQLECRDPASAQTDFAHLPDAAQAVAAPPILDLRPGSSAMLHDPDLLDATAFLRRPFSIARHEPGTSHIDIIHRVVGRGTRFLERLRKGDDISVLGPLGKGFWVPEDVQTALLVGGGVGIPPMLYMADALGARGERAIAFVGAQRKDLIPLTFAPDVPPASPAGDPVLNVAEFARHGIPAVLTTDDGSLGMKGYVTGALDRFLSQDRAEAARMAVFCCGPTPMMKATAKVAAAHGVRCFVSLEQPMACGMGTCQSCVVKVKPAGGGAEDWAYRLTCTDGPVFDASVLRW